MNVVAYLRVSTTEQADSGLGLAAQRAKIQDEATRKGWHVTWCVDEGYSGKATGRPALTHALHLLATGKADALAVAKMDRLARSVLQASDVLETARKQKWSVLILDLGMDLSTPHGKAMAQMLAVFAELEREMIAQRTREALAAAKARGQRLGRPRQIDAALLARVVALRESGLSLRAIATALNDDGTPTVRGGRCWHPATIRGLLQSAALDNPDAETDLSAPKKEVA